MLSELLHSAKFEERVNVESETDILSVQDPNHDNQEPSRGVPLEVPSGAFGADCPEVKDEAERRSS